MSPLLRFGLETSLLNVIGWGIGALAAALLLGPLLRRKGVGFGVRWACYSALAALAGLASYVGFGGGTIAEALIAGISMFVVAGAVVGAVMAVAALVKKPRAA